MSDWSTHTADLALAVEDAFASHTISINARTPGELNGTTLKRAATTSLLSDLPAARDPVELIDDNGQRLVGFEYTVRSALLGATLPAVGDLVLEGAATRTIVNVAIDADGAIVRLRVRDRAATKG